MRGLGITDSTTGDWLTLLILPQLHLATAPAPHLSAVLSSDQRLAPADWLEPNLGSRCVEVPQSTPPLPTPLFSPRPLSLTAYNCLSKPTSIPENAVHAPALSVCRSNILQTARHRCFQRGYGDTIKGPEL